MLVKVRSIMYHRQYRAVHKQGTEGVLLGHILYFRKDSFLVPVIIVEVNKSEEYKLFHQAQPMAT